MDPQPANGVGALTCTWERMRFSHNNPRWRSGRFCSDLWHKPSTLPVHTEDMTVKEEKARTCNGQHIQGAPQHLDVGELLTWLGWTPKALGHQRSHRYTSCFCLGQKLRARSVCMQRTAGVSGDAQLQPSKTTATKTF